MTGTRHGNNAHIGVVPLGPLYHCYRLWGLAANASSSRP